MSDDRAEAARRAGKRLLGGLLMAGGGMIALLCGLCTFYFGLAGLASAGRGGGAAGLLLVALVVGGAPTAVGVLLFWVGLRLWRDGRPRLAKPWKEFE